MKKEKRNKGRIYKSHDVNRESPPVLKLGEFFQQYNFLSGALQLTTICESTENFIDYKFAAGSVWNLIKFVTVQYLHSYMQKIHSKSATPMGFLPSSLCFLTVSAASAQTY